MADTMDRAQNYWANVERRADNWQQREDYRQACQAAHAWAVQTMGGK